MSEKITCPRRPGRPTWPLFKIKTETEADKNTLPPRPGRPTWPLYIIKIYKFHVFQ